MSATPVPVLTPSLYVGDLAPDVPESFLYETFNNVGQVASIRICRDANTRRSLGYAYVNFHRLKDAERALDTMNFREIYGRPCRIMWVQHDPGLRKSGVGNVFIKNLPKSVDNQQLCDTFSQWGSILSCKVATDKRGSSLGYGFVHYSDKETAEKVIRLYDGKALPDTDGKSFIVSIAPFKSKAERGSVNQFTNLYAKNFPLELTDEAFEKLFTQYGEINSAKVMRAESGESRGFGFVNFANHSEAQAAIDALHDTSMGESDKKLYVQRAMSKKEREEKLAQYKLERAKKYQGVNLYVKNLSDKIDNDTLRQEFSAFGSITSAVVMRDADKKTSKGFGFVCFSAPEEANEAMTKMNGKMLDGKPIYVALAERRIDRENRFKNRWTQGRPGPKGGVAPMYPVPSMGPPRYVMNGGQMMHPAWNQQALPMQARLGAPQMNYSLMPAAQRNGPPRRGGRMRPNQGQPRQGQNFKYTDNARNNQRQTQPQQQPLPPAQPKAAPVSEETDFVKELAAMPEEQRKGVIGEKLYPLVAEFQPELAPKITGMLLEMENTEIIELLDSPQALNSKIEEAMKVLTDSNDAEQ